MEDPSLKWAVPVSSRRGVSYFKIKWFSVINGPKASESSNLRIWIEAGEKVSAIKIEITLMFPLENHTIYWWLTRIGFRFKAA